MSRSLSCAVEHGVVCRLGSDRFGYFGWPSVARLKDGTLIAASSGLRTRHVCPWGKTVLNVSTDDGQSWSAPRVINDSPIDDRDAGIVALGGNRLLVSWFTSDTRSYLDANRKNNNVSAAELDAWQTTTATWTDAMVEHQLGSWVMLSEDRGATWGAPIRVPVTAPHGPVLLRNGDILYFGRETATSVDDLAAKTIAAVLSHDGGRTWKTLGNVPVYPGTDPVNYHEPHVVELPSGRLLGAIRIQDHSGVSLEGTGIPSFSIMLTESDDGGRTWSQARPMGFHGSPPHLVRHSSGVLVLTYGCRQPPYGQRVALSHDDGATWDHDWIIRDDGPDGDLGYPATVELADGGLFTVYYQKVPGDEKCALLWSRWTLPD